MNPNSRIWHESVLLRSKVRLSRKCCKWGVRGRRAHLKAPKIKSNGTPYLFMEVNTIFVYGGCYLFYVIHINLSSNIFTILKTRFFIFNLGFVCYKCWQNVRQTWVHTIPRLFGSSRCDTTHVFEYMRAPACSFSASSPQRHSVAWQLV
jgi:hypothetical protein